MPAHRRMGIVVALRVGMALFWQNPKAQPAAPKPMPLSPLTIALLLKLQADAEAETEMPTRAAA